MGPPGGVLGLSWGGPGGSWAAPGPPGWLWRLLGPPERLCGRASCRSTSCDCCSWLKRRALASSIVSDLTGQSKGSCPTPRQKSIQSGTVGTDWSSQNSGAGASSCPLEETGTGCRPTVRFFRGGAKQLLLVGLPPCHKLGAVFGEEAIDCPC